MKNDRPNKKRQGYRVTATVVPQPHGIEPNFVRWQTYYSEFEENVKQVLLGK